VRVVYLAQYLTTPDMDGGSRAYEFARRLAASGCNVHVVTSDRDRSPANLDRPRWRVTREAGFTAHWCAVPYSNHMGYAARVRAFATFALRAAHRAATLPQDLVFATSTPLTIALPAVYAKWRRRVPMVFEVRDVWPEVPIALGVLRHPLARSLARGLESFAYRNAAEIIALSPGMERSISARHPRTSVTVVPNSSDLGLFDGRESEAARFRKDRPWLQDRPLLVYTGTFGLVNGVGYLVRMARALMEMGSDLRVLLVGSGREEAAVRAMADELGVLGTNLFIEAPMKKSEIPVVLAACDVASSVVIDVPELWANSANKVFDAFAAGRPVLLNHQGWLADVVRDSGAGLIVDPNDPVAAAHEIDRLVSDSDALKAAGSAARRLATERFDRDLLFEKFAQVLARAAAREGEPCPAGMLPDVSEPSEQADHS
jgi:glycosyltransferase involved in cell wall biosynthesis